MDKNAGVFNFSRLERVVYGPGSIAALAAELDARGLSRVLVVTGRTLGSSPQMEQLKSALGSCLVGSFKEVREHVPAASVRAIVQEIERTEADALLSFGGGSPNDAAKIAIACIIAGRDLTTTVSDTFFGHPVSAQVGRILFHICVPTTLSAGEYHDDGAGFSDDDGVKRAVVDPRMGPGLIINDAELCDATPDWLWASTGLRALDHGVEALYSARSDNFTDVLARESIRLLIQHLPPSVSAGAERVPERAWCQVAACLSNYAGANTRYGPSHIVGAVVGARFHIPHGVTSVIALPAAMRFMARRTPDRFGLIADVLGVEVSLSPDRRALTCADIVETFMASVHKPARLRDYGALEGHLPDVATMVRGFIQNAGMVGDDVSVAEIRELIQACW